MGLLDLIDQHRQALEYDLISLGLRLRDLGSRRFTWSDLKVIVGNLPRNAALMRAIHGADQIDWDLNAQLLAILFDRVGVTNYYLQRLGGNDKAEEPEPLPRPGVKPAAQAWQGAQRSMEDMAQLLGWGP